MCNNFHVLVSPMDGFCVEIILTKEKFFYIDIS